MKTIKIEKNDYIPFGFTGIAEYPDGTKRWFKEGKLHRGDGPAIEYVDGTGEFWYEGLNCQSEEWQFGIE